MPSQKWAPREHYPQTGRKLHRTKYKVPHSFPRANGNTPGPRPAHHHNRIYPCPEQPPMHPTEQYHHRAQRSPPQGNTPANTPSSRLPTQPRRMRRHAKAPGHRSSSATRQCPRLSHSPRPFPPRGQNLPPSGKFHGPKYIKETRNT